MRPPGAVAVPSRVFVGVVVFGLIASLVTGTYTLLILSGYQPPPDPTVITFEPPEEPSKRFFLVLSTIFSVALTPYAWRELVRGARRDASRRQQREALERQQKAYARQMREGKRPPGAA